MLPMVVLVVLIVVNLGSSFRPIPSHQALTAEPADQDRAQACPASAERSVANGDALTFRTG